MEYKTSKNTITLLSKIIKYLSFLVVLSIACNFIFAILLWHESRKEKIILVPTNLTQKAIIKTNSVDANYLLQCAMFFISTRLDVTPDTIDSHDALILDHTSSQYYALFKNGLIKEAGMIKEQKVSSSFYVSHIKTNPTDFTVYVQGNLKRWVGERPLSDSKKQYKLRFTLEGSELFLTTFEEVR